MDKKVDIRLLIAELLDGPSKTRDLQQSRFIILQSWVDINRISIRGVPADKAVKEMVEVFSLVKH